MLDISLQAKHTATLSKAYAARTGLYEISNVCEQDSQPFLLTPKQLPVMQARCDMETDGGGWMVILPRKSNVSPQVNFNRTWTEYENGFGDLLNSGMAYETSTASRLVILCSFKFS